MNNVFLGGDLDEKMFKSHLRVLRLYNLIEIACKLVYKLNKTHYSLKQALRV